MENVKVLKILTISIVLLLQIGGCKDDSSPFNPDASTDTDTDGDTDSDADTDTYPNPCPDGEHSGCYADNVWCLEDGTDTPITELDECTGGEQCVVQSPVFAECVCVSDWYRQCYDGTDVWAYDSCDELDFLVESCALPKECVNLSATEADCCELDAVQQCNADDDVTYFDDCSENGAMEGDVVIDCADYASCSNTSTTEAECDCPNEWEGDDCNTCPGNWDPAQNCNACIGYWTGATCDTCSGYGDMCQCPNDSYAPQYGSNRCWSCALPDVAAGGVCPFYSGSTLMHTWTSATTACPAGSRLPTRDEFLSLFDNTSASGDYWIGDDCASSSVCSQTFFENGRLNVAWSSTACSSSGEHWKIRFSPPYVMACWDDSDPKPVHCVLD